MNSDYYFEILKSIGIFGIFFVKQTSLPEDTSELRLPGVFNTCGAYSDKKARKKFGFVLEPVDTENNEQVNRALS